MTTPDTLASLIVKMPHRSTNGEYVVEADSKWHDPKECLTCKGKAALDALKNR